MPTISQKTKIIKPQQRNQIMKTGLRRKTFVVRRELETFMAMKKIVDPLEGYRELCFDTLDRNQNEELNERGEYLPYWFRTPYDPNHKTLVGEIYQFEHEEECASYEQVVLKNGAYDKYLTDIECRKYRYGEELSEPKTKEASEPKTKDDIMTQQNTFFNPNPIDCESWKDLTYFLVEKGDIERWGGLEIFCESRPDIGIILKVLLEFIKVGIVGDPILGLYLDSLEPKNCDCEEKQGWCPRHV
jgi:hypothetical protein